MPGLADFPSTLALRTGFGRSAGFCAISPASVASFIFCYFNFLIRTENSFLKGYCYLILKISSPAGCCSTGSSGTAAKSKHISKNICEIREINGFKTGSAIRTSYTLMTKPIVGCAFISIGQYTVGLVGFFELLFCIRGVAYIRVVLTSQIAESAL